MDDDDDVVIIPGWKTSESRSCRAPMTDQLLCEYSIPGEQDSRTDTCKSNQTKYNQRMDK